MAKAKPGQVVYMGDMSAASDLVGALKGAYAAATGNRYLPKLMDRAIMSTVVKFNAAAVSQGKAGNFKHMFEWGTAGIHGGAGPTVSDESSSARLWEHKMLGAGKNRELAFNFKDSKQFVPSSIDSYYGHVGSYIFREKARLTEQGQVVRFGATDSRYVLIPNYPSMRYPGEEGFIIRRNIDRPSRHQVPSLGEPGSFTAFWFSFWNSYGQTEANRIANQQFEEDLQKQRVWKQSRSSARMRPMESINLNADIERVAQEVKKTMESYDVG